MVLVAKEALAVLLGPLGIPILLGQLTGFLRPSPGSYPFLEQAILLPAVPLPGDLHEAGIYDFAVVNDEPDTVQLRKE